MSITAMLPEAGVEGWAQPVGLVIHHSLLLFAVVTFCLVLLIARNAARLMRLAGPYAGLMIARLLYIFLAAKAVAMVPHGVEKFLTPFLAALAGAVTVLT